MSFPLQQTLDNGITLTFSDETNRYFGDYHRVCLRVCFSLPLTPELIPDDIDYGAAKKALGDRLCYDKTLERMGVPSSQVEAVRQELLAQYQRMAQDYIARAGFPEQFLRRTLAVRRSRSAGY